MPAQPLSSSQPQCPAMKPWSRRQSSAKHVVIAGITPFQFMKDLLCSAAPIPKDREPCSDLRGAQAKSGGALNPNPSGTGIPLQDHTLFPGRHPFRNGFVAWRHEKSDSREGEKTAHLHIGRRWSRPTVDVQVPTANGRFELKPPQNRGLWPSWGTMLVLLRAYLLRSSQQSRLPRPTTQDHQFQWVLPR